MDDAVVQVGQRLRGAHGAQALQGQAAHGLAVVAEHQQAERARLVPQQPPGAVLVHLANRLRQHWGDSSTGEVKSLQSGQLRKQHVNTRSLKHARE